MAWHGGGGASEQTSDVRTAFGRSLKLSQSQNGAGLGIPGAGGGHGAAQLFDPTTMSDPNWSPAFKGCEHDVWMDTVAPK
jgi:hypothetical protein